MTAAAPGLMFVHAHPDDETTTTGATIAHYAARGVTVHLVTCTRGEQGEFVDPDAPADLLTRVGGRSAPRTGHEADAFGRLRVTELARACRALGIPDAELLGGHGRWQDSGMAGATADPASFAQADPDDCTRALVALVRAHRPLVLVTYDADGGYGHPDHIRAHQITVAAFHAAADPGAYTDCGPPWSVRRLYAAVVGHSALLAAAEHLAAAPPRGPNPFAMATTGSALPFGVPDSLIDVRVDATDHLPAKIAAMRAHRSQMHPQGWFFVLATRPGSLMGHESYVLLHHRGDPVRPNPGRSTPDDLLGGI